MIRVDAFDQPVDELGPEHINPDMLRSLASALHDLPGAGEQASDAVRLAAREIERLRKIKEAAQLRRNTLIMNRCGLKGFWVAVPQADFDRLRRALHEGDEDG